jgi:hypothetical protein
MMDDHASGRRNYSEGLDRVTTLVLAQKLFAERASPGRT